MITIHQPEDTNFANIQIYFTKWPMELFVCFLLHPARVNCITRFNGLFSFFSVSRLMGSTATTANMGHGLNHTGMPLGACAVPDSKPMQFPLAQRRKRRVLFTQAQVTHPFPFSAKPRATLYNGLNCSGPGRRGPKRPPFWATPPPPVARFFRVSPEFNCEQHGGDN